MQSLLTSLYPLLKENYALDFVQIGLLTFAFQVTASLLRPAVGVITEHRASATLRYERLFDETMYLYCGRDHALFDAQDSSLDWANLRRRSDFAGLGYHSPNMELAHAERLPRKATGFEQEAIATLILSGQFVGFLPDHYADSFVQRGQMRALHPALLHYRCDFVSVLRRSPQPSRAALVFHQALLAAHSMGG